VSCSYEPSAKEPTIVKARLEDSCYRHDTS
jgi:hypothetical protein